MVIKYLLDTDIVISALKGKQTVDELLHLGEEGAAAALSVITVYEIWEGIYGSKKISPEAGEQQFNQFVDKYVEELIPIDVEIARTAGKIRSQLRQTGQVIPDTDILIASTCIVNDLTLVTKNRRHFGRVKQLNILK